MPIVTIDVSISGVGSFEELGRTWRALEAEASGLSFFQSWTWVGCLAEERFTDPVLVRADRDGRLVGLALFNRTGRRWRRRLCLTESGSAELDAPFIEHNAPLIAAEGGRQVLPALLSAAWRAQGVRRLVLNGAPHPVLDAAGGLALRKQERVAPVVRLDAVRAAGQDYLAQLSANTRYQLRRSLRRYGRRGEVVARRAETTDEALDWFDALVGLHQRTWAARGKPGAFGGEFMLRFHRALIARAAGQDQLDLIRVSAGDTDVGFLYNLRVGGWVHAYQSGFDYRGCDPAMKPGMTCHHLAIERSLRAGDAAYDFLAGASRYKSSMANASTTLAWCELAPRFSVAATAARVLRALRRGGGAGRA